MKLSKLYRILLFLTILNSLLFYIGWHGWVWLEVAFELQNPFIYSVAFIVLSYSFIISRISKSLAFFRIISYLWFGVIHFAIMLFPVADIVVVILVLTGTPLETAIYITGLVVIILLAVLFAYGLFNAYIPVVKHYQVQIPKKHSTRSKLTIAVASDMHFGGLSGVSHLKRLVAIINEIKPDLILLPGDIVDDDPEPFIEKKMDTIMKNLQAPLGVYGVLGNHEYYGGKIPAFVKHMRDINITILMDEAVTIEDSFYLIGRKDKTDKARKSFEKLADEVDRSLPIFAMDHQPFELKQAQQTGVDLLVSGHTHKGQLAPYHLITKKMFELDWGYVQKDQLHAFVSSGYGFWGPPIRLGSRSEVLKIDVIFGE